MAPSRVTFWVSSSGWAWKLCPDAGRGGPEVELPAMVRFAGRGVTHEVVAITTVVELRPPGAASAGAVSAGGATELAGAPSPRR